MENKTGFIKFNSILEIISGAIMFVLAILIAIYGYITLTIEHNNIAWAFVIIIIMGLVIIGIVLSIIFGCILISSGIYSYRNLNDNYKLSKKRNVFIVIGSLYVFIAIVAFIFGIAEKILCLGAIFAAYFITMAVLKFVCLKYIPTNIAISNEIQITANTYNATDKK